MPKCLKILLAHDRMSARAARRALVMDKLPHKLSSSKKRKLEKMETKALREPCVVASDEESYLSEDELPPEHLGHHYNEYDCARAAEVLHSYISEHHPEEGLMATTGLPEFYEAHAPEGVIVWSHTAKKFILQHPTLFVWDDNPHPGRIMAVSAPPVPAAVWIAQGKGQVKALPPNSTLGRVDKLGWGDGARERCDGGGGGGGFGTPGAFMKPSFLPKLVKPKPAAKAKAKAKAKTKMKAKAKAKPASGKFPKAAPKAAPKAVPVPKPKETLWLLTQHCKERMEERNISRREVRQCLVRGTPTAAGGSRKFWSYQGLVVITDPAKMWIITCYFPPGGTFESGAAVFGPGAAMPMLFGAGGGAGQPNSSVMANWFGGVGGAAAAAGAAGAAEEEDDDEDTPLTVGAIICSSSQGSVEAEAGAEAEAETEAEAEAEAGAGTGTGTEAEAETAQADPVLQATVARWRMAGAGAETAQAVAALLARVAQLEDITANCFDEPTEPNGGAYKAT